MTKTPAIPIRLASPTTLYKSQPKQSEKSKEIEHDELENNKEETSVKSKEPEENKIKKNNKNPVETVAALLTIRELSMTFKDLQINIINFKDKHRQFKQHEELKLNVTTFTTIRTTLMVSNKKHTNPLTHNAWNKKRRHKSHHADPFQFDLRYKKRKKKDRIDGTMDVLQQKMKHKVDPLIHDTWNKKRKHKRKGADNWLIC